MCAGVCRELFMFTYFVCNFRHNAIRQYFKRATCNNGSSGLATRIGLADIYKIPIFHCCLEKSCEHNPVRGATEVFLDLDGLREPLASRDG
jgi:hypothetical protein